MSVTRVARGSRGATITLADPEVLGGFAGNATATVRNASTAAIIGAPIVVAFDAAAALYRLALPPAATVSLGLVLVEWSIEGAIAAIEAVDVVGDVLFTLADARRDDFIPPARATDDEVLRARSSAERQLEEACEVALARRVDTHRGRPTGRGLLALPHRQPAWDPAPITILTAGNEGGALSAASLNLLRADRYGAIAGLPAGTTNAAVTYEHGPVRPPARAMTAALTLAKNQLLEGPIDTRALGVAVEGGGSIGLATPGLRGATFGIPEVDAFVQEYGVRGRRT